jgi:serine/threonine protein kinase
MMASSSKGGFPLTSVREIKLLRALRHPNVVDLQEVVVGRKPSNVFLLFEYCEHDLSGLLRRMPQPFSEAQVKRIMLQLLSAVAYLHENFILHRDIKLANMLMNNRGQVKLADFGLARDFAYPVRAYTPNVVTLWSRPPELLLGSQIYHTAVDVWAVGCVFGELLKNRPLLPGASELKQLDLIFKLLGTPNEHVWPGYAKLNTSKIQFQHYPYNSLSHEFPQLSAHGIDLLSMMLTYDPSKRISAAQALQHPYFTEAPRPCPQELMPTFQSQSASNAAAAMGSTQSRTVQTLIQQAKSKANRTRGFAAAFSGGGASSIASAASAVDSSSGEPPAKRTKL